LASTSCPTLEQEIVRFTVARLCAVASAVAQTLAPALNSAPRDRLAQDLVGRGLIACTATDAHDAVSRPPVVLHCSFGDLKLS
jgi:hypothetical protein